MRVFRIGIPAVAILVIGWLDYVTGPDIGFSLVYLIPIAFVAWHGGIHAAVGVAVIAALAWLSADLLWRDDGAIGISLWNAFTRLVIYVTEGVFIAILHRDREVMRSMIEREAALARTDDATSLPNSRAFMEALEAELARGNAVSLVYLDLDNFKLVNDRQGHRAGDDVLAAVAAVLRGSIRDGDLAARVGGDEFALLLRGTDAPAARFIAEQVVRRVREIGVANDATQFGATVGVAFARPGMSAEELLHEADVAMYEAKSTAKGTVVLARQNP